MICAMRRLANAAYTPYWDRIWRLQGATPQLLDQFIMVSKNTDHHANADYYIGLPNETFLNAFDGFKVVSEDELPAEIDNLLVGESGDEFARACLQSGD
jgi:hypothetical protein